MFTKAQLQEAERRAQISRVNPAVHKQVVDQIVAYVAVCTAKVAAFRQAVATNQDILWVLDGRVESVIAAAERERLLRRTAHVHALRCGDLSSDDQKEHFLVLVEQLKLLMKSERIDFWPSSTAPMDNLQKMCCAYGRRQLKADIEYWLDFVEANWKKESQDA